MNSLLSTKLPAFKLATRWTGAAAITVGALFAATTVSAAAPASGTSIGNQASASYRDPQGNTQSAQSNRVDTIVSQVGSLTLTADGARSAAAGITVYVPHTLTNTGNGDDGFKISVTESNAATAPDFTRIEVFIDNGSGGAFGTALCSITTPAGTCTTPTQAIAGSNGQLKFVVAYTVPSNIVGAWVNKATVTAARVGTTIPYGTESAANTDTITLTDQAAFSVTKSITQPAVGAGSVAWPGIATSGPRGTRTMYTFAYTNNGGGPGTLVLSDTLPAGMTYVPNSAVWSSAPGVSLDDAAGGAETANSGIEYEAVSGVIKARIATVNTNVSGTLSFVVQVAPTAPINIISNIGNYSPVNCGGTTVAGSGACFTAATNSVPFTVTANYGVIFGVSPTPVADTTAGTPNSSGDTVTMPSVAQGKSVRFQQLVKNTGNAVDTFNLSITGAGATGTAFPAGTTYTWLGSDGATPLTDTDGNGIVDTGPLDPAASRIVFLQVVVPSTVTLNAGPFSVVALAKSFGDAKFFDSVQDVVTSVVTASIVDMTSGATPTNIVGDQGPGPGPSPIKMFDAWTGKVAEIPLYVTNYDSAPLSFGFGASSSATFPGALPVGFGVTYSTSPCAAPTPITTLDNLGAGASKSIYACVTVPDSDAASIQPLYFRIASTGPAASTGAVASDIIYDALNILVTPTKIFTVSSGVPGQAAPNGTVVYAHTISNIGNQSCGAFNITALPTAAALANGWTTSIFLDVDGNAILTPTDTLITDGTVASIAAYSNLKILVRVFAPSGAIVGNSEAVTVTVTDKGTNNCMSSGVIPSDTTTVSSGQLTIVTTQVADPTCMGTVPVVSGATMNVKPGQCIVYQVVATNTSASPVNNIMISDTVPSYTTYAGAVQPLAQCTGSGVAPSPGLLTSGIPVTGITCGGTSNTINPGGILSMKFAVKIAQ